MAQVFVVVVCDTVAVNPSAVTAIVGPTTPLVVLYAVPRLLVYFTESAKYASSAVIRLRRSDFIEARYAFSFVFANFGIAIAAKMPMITTTIKSSMSVKPLRFIWRPPYGYSDTGDTELFGRHRFVLGGMRGTNRALVRTATACRNGADGYAVKRRTASATKGAENSGYLRGFRPLHCR